MVEIKTPVAGCGVREASVLRAPTGIGVEKLLLLACLRATRLCGFEQNKVHWWILPNKAVLVADGQRTSRLRGCFFVVSALTPFALACRVTWAQSSGSWRLAYRRT